MNEIKERIVKHKDGYFFDCETGDFIKLSDEIVDAIEAPSSDFQEGNERWELVKDLFEDMLNRTPFLKACFGKETNAEPRQ